jgi:glycine oxidase
LSGRARDVLVVGAGVIGCATALELARRGVRTTVLERSVPGAEASSAAAGMLGAQVEAHAPGPFADLCIASRARFADWAARLRELSGIDIEHRVCGITKVAVDASGEAELEAHAHWQRSAGQRVELLSARSAREIEPTLGERVVGAAHYPDDGRVDPPRLLRALRIAAERCGAVFRSGSIVERIVVAEGRARGVVLDGAEHLASEHVVVAAGSWASLVGGTPLPHGAIRPARGQIVEVTLPCPILRGVVWGPGAYLSPRDDGRVLIGATMEFVGFERAVTAGAVRDLISAATRLVPALERAEWSRAWAAFRPHTSRDAPYIGRSAVPGIWLAAGHFRNGILLSPITAEILAARILGEAPPFDPTPFEAP